MDRRLLDYLPPVIGNLREMQAITDGQEAVLSDLWEAVGEAFKNQFVEEATAYGIERWEKILSIVPKGAESLETRRFRIKTRLNEQLPFTLRSLQQSLEALCGEDGVRVNFDVGSYQLVVRIEYAARANYDDVRAMLERVAPANIVVNLDVKYNSHESLEDFIHEELAEYTHAQVQYDVLKHGGAHRTHSQLTEFRCENLSTLTHTEVRS